jgi:hypothetical protein
VCVSSAAVRGGAVQRVHDDIDAYCGRLHRAVDTRKTELHQQADNTASERVTRLDEQQRELAIFRSKVEYACVDEEAGVRGTAQQLFCPAVARTARTETVRVCVSTRLSLFVCWVMTATVCS